MIATGLTESRKLVAIGIDTSTADMHYAFSAIGGEQFQDMIDASATLMVGRTNRKYPYEPAWSVGALIDLLPAVLTDEKGDYYLEIGKFGANGNYVVQYINEDNFPIMRYRNSGKELIICLWLTVCDLKKANKL